MSNDYDVEKYDREREERIRHLESLKDRAEEEFNSYSYHGSEGRELYEYVEDGDDSGRKWLITMTSVALIGFMGYIGYGYLSGGSDRGEEVAKDNNTQKQVEEESKPNVKDKIESIVSTAIVHTQAESSSNIAMMERPEEPSITKNIIEPNRENKIEIIENSVDRKAEAIPTEVVTTPTATPTPTPTATPEPKTYRGDYP